MFFIFNNECHRSTSFTYRARTSTRGKFNFEVLRERFGKKYKVWPCGTHPVQSRINELHTISRSELLNGHVLEIKDDDLALPILLNWHPYVKDDTQFVGAFRNFDFLADYNLEPIEKLITKRRNIKGTRKDIENYNRFGKSIINRNYDDKVSNRIALCIKYMEKEDSRIREEQIAIDLECLTHEIKIDNLLAQHVLSVHN